MRHIFGSACHIFSKKPLILTDFYAIQTLIVWHIFGAICFFANMGGWGWSELFSKRAVSSKVGFGESTLVPVFGRGEHPNVPSSRFLVEGNIRMYPRSGFGTGEHPPKPPFWKPRFCEPPTHLRSDDNISRPPPPPQGTQPSIAKKADPPPKAKRPLPRPLIAKKADPPHKARPLARPLIAKKAHPPPKAKTPLPRPLRYQNAPLMIGTTGPVHLRPEAHLPTTTPINQHIHLDHLPTLPDPGL